MAIGVPRAEGSVGVECLQARLLQHAVEVEYALNVRLAMVAHDDEVGMRKVAVAADGLHEYAQFAVVLFQLLAGEVRVHAEAVADAVQIAHLHEHHVRLMIVADDVRGDGIGEHIETAVDGLVEPAQQVSVLPEIAVEQFGGGNALVVLPGIVAMVAHGHDHGKVEIHIRAGADRPVDQAGGVARLFGVLGEELLFHHLALCVPGHGMHARLHHLVVGDAVAVGIAAGHDGDVAGIGERGVDRQHLLHQRAALQNGAEVGQRAHIGNVEFAQGVDHKDEEFVFHGSSGGVFIHARGPAGAPPILLVK